MQEIEEAQKQANQAQKWQMSPVIVGMSGREAPPYMYEIKSTVKANAEEALKECKNTEGWKQMTHYHKGKVSPLTLSTKDFGDLLGVKAVCTIGASRELIVHTLQNEKLSKQSSKPKVLEQVTDDLSVYWMGVKAPIVKDRDFLLAEWNCQQPNGAHLNTFVSVKHPLDPKNSKKYVRGFIKMGAWHISPQGGVTSNETCNVTWVSVVDASGSIPSAIKKMGAPAGAEAVLRLKELAEKAARG